MFMSNIPTVGKQNLGFICSTHRMRRCPIKEISKQKQKGTGADECLRVHLPYSWERKLKLTTQAFFKMPNLRILRINGSYKSITFIEWESSHDNRIFFFRNLVWFCWDGFPFEYIPNNFYLGKLNILEIHFSQNSKKFGREPRLFKAK
ncbi:hypothetical protein NE237_020927 [Protea cynaroides]|uniref:Uncharacterized protein n=1 Tax=Protea cynaroides TaxID=273540 RepID=A0A9Q0HBI0_9MAGN|nr:hypothetical protein NE237_020927 [Protea cynaroides]